MTRQIRQDDGPFALDFHSVKAAEGELIIMAPAGGKTRISNANIITLITSWAQTFGTGPSFDSSTMFCLPNGARRSPDAAWIRGERWSALTPAEREGFVPLCPDFVVELRSSTESLTFLQDKMQEYISNGAQLGLLIDPKSKQGYVYRPNSTVECLYNPQSLKGDPEMPGFVLDFNQIW